MAIVHRRPSTHTTYRFRIRWRRSLSKHNAPAVVYPVKRSKAFGALTVLLWCAGALVVAVWVWRSGDRFDMANWRLGLAVFAVMVSAIGAASFLKISGQGHLVWDGELWHDQRAMRPKSNWWDGSRSSFGALNSRELDVRIVVDIQRAMLLHLARGRHDSRWLWVEKSAQPERWLDLRRAVYARPRRIPADLDAASATSTPKASSL